MRIVAGRFKGRRLTGPKGGAARPTSDKVREALFSILGSVDGLRVLDLFAGTGALGIEALSRGATHVTFVERDNRMRAVLRANVDVTAGGAQADSVKIVGGDARDHLRRAAGVDLYDLVLLDPPYADASRLAGPLAALLPPVLAPGAVVAAECDRRAPLALEAARGDAVTGGDVHPALRLNAERRYGDTLVRIFTAPDAD